MMKTQPPAPAELRPRYAEQQFVFEVTGLPDSRSPYYRIEARPEDSETAAVYTLYYRRNDFSVERVTRREAREPEQEVIRHGRVPFIYYERRLPIAPDFPVAAEPLKPGKQEFKVERNRLTQTIEPTDSGLRIVLEQVEPSGSLRVVMEWVAGEPWWSTIECTENPPPTSRLPGQVVAAGYLLKGSIVTKERAPAPR